jgi:hypothetical protein
MQRKDVLSESADPDLGNGLAFFGEVNGYMAHLEKHWDQKQPVSPPVLDKQDTDAFWDLPEKHVCRSRRG